MAILGTLSVSNILMRPNLKNCSTTKGTPSTPVTVCPACRFQNMIIETNGSKAQVGGENVINTLHNRHKVTKPLMCNNEYLVKVHKVAGLATKWDEEPHASFTLTMRDDEKL